MPRSRNRGKSAIIVMPTLREVKVSVPPLFSQHKSAASTKYQKPHSKAHIFIKKVFGQIIMRKYRQDSQILNYNKKADYIGRMKPLGEGTYSKKEINQGGNKKTTAWNHPNQQQTNSEKALKPFADAQKERYPKLSKVAQLIWNPDAQGPFIGSIRATFTGARRNNKVAQPT